MPFLSEHIHCRNVIFSLDIQKINDDFLFILKYSPTNTKIPNIVIFILHPLNAVLAGEESELY